MDKSKKINFKKQIHSLKFIYEEQLLETKALISRVHNLENIFKLTKQFIKEKKNNNFNFKNEKRYLLITNQMKNISKNLVEQSKTLLKSVLYNKYLELQKQKESLIQELEEKTNILKTLKNELNLYKIYRSYGNHVSHIYLNNALNSLLTNNNKNNTNNETSNIVKKNFKNIINKENIKLKIYCEQSCSKLKAIYNISLNKYEKMIKENGFNYSISNQKSNKTYEFTIEPVKDEYNNSSNESSESENCDDDEEDEENNSNSINDHIFDQEKDNNTKKLNFNRSFLVRQKNNSKNKNSFLQNITYFKDENSEINNREISIKNLFNYKGKKDINTSANFSKIKFGLMTEINNGRGGELNKKLLKVKENYYKCLDQRYELKNSLKSNISQIYNIKEKIKKYKKENNIK